MKRVLILKVAAAVLVFASVVPASLAQTGPGNQGAPLPGPGQGGLGGGFGQMNNMTANRLANLLQGDGHKTQTKAHPNGGGQTVYARVQRDGWQFDLEFEFNPAGTNLNVVCPLGNAATKFSADQLLALMKKSYELPPPLHFSYRANDQKLCLEDPSYSPLNMTDASLRQILDTLLKTVRDTYPLWDSSRWPVNGQMPVGQQGFAPKVPKVQAFNQGLVNTTWVGTETLDGLGRLEFRFQANGQVLRIDDGFASQKGTYTQTGNTVTLRFYQGAVVYTGSINGQILAGTVTNGEETWKFSVSR